jgi:hypothetical protein
MLRPRTGRPLTFAPAGSARTPVDVDRIARRARRSETSLPQVWRPSSTMRSCCSPWERLTTEPANRIGFGEVEVCCVSSRTGEKAETEKGRLATPGACRTARPMCALRAPSRDGGVRRAKALFCQAQIRFVTHNSHSRALDSFSIHNSTRSSVRGGQGSVGAAVSTERAGLCAAHPRIASRKGLGPLRPPARRRHPCRSHRR